MRKEEFLKRLSEKLDGLTQTVKNDSNLSANMADYNVTLNSLKKKILEAYKLPDEFRGRTKTGRMYTKTPNLHTMPKTKIPDAPDGITGMTGPDPEVKVPMTDRRAAIEHTRQLNARSDNN